MSAATARERRTLSWADTFPASFADESTTVPSGNTKSIDASVR